MAWSPTTPAEVTARVDDHRRGKVERLDAVLRNLPGDGLPPWGGEAADDLPLRYALAHHLFEGVSRAVRAGDVARTPELLALRSDQSALGVASTAAGPVVTVNPERDVMVQDERLAAAPVALLSPESCATTTAADRELVRTALGIATDAGFGDLVSHSTRAVVLIAKRSPADHSIRSWTTNALPVTVHTDYFAEPAYLARDLVHEAAHSRLNDLFSAHGVALPDDVRYYAPWLDAHRPVFGFLHGIWAFSHVVLFCRWLAGSHPSPSVRALAELTHAKHSEHMSQSREDLYRAVALVSAPEVAELIVGCRDEVLSGHPAR